MHLKVKVIPKASVNTVVEFKEDVLKVKLTAVPEKGLANKALIALLSKVLKIPKSAIRILKGESSSSKILELDGMCQQDLLNRLEGVI